MNQNTPEYQAKLAEHMANIRRNQRANYTEERQEAIKQQKEQERQRLFIQKRERINNYVNEFGEYWEYKEAKCFVPINQFESVPSIDKCNTTSLMFFNGKPEITQTEMFMDCPPYTVDEYHNTYCKQEGDKWIFVGKNN